MSPRPQRDDVDEASDDEPLDAPRDGLDEPRDAQDELRRVAEKERALVARHRALRGPDEDASKATATPGGARRGAAYREIDAEARAEQQLEEAHERLANLQIEAAILEAGEARRRHERFGGLFRAAPWLLVLVVPALIGLAAQELFWVSAVLWTLGLLLYWLVGRIEPKPGDAPRPRYPGSGG